MMVIGADLASIAGFLNIFKERSIKRENVYISLFLALYRTFFEYVEKTYSRCKIEILTFIYLIPPSRIFGSFPIIAAVSYNSH